MKYFLFFLLLCAQVVGQAQDFIGGVSLSMLSSRFSGDGTKNNSYLDGMGGVFAELKSEWGIRATVQYYRQRGSLTELGEISAYKTSAELCARRYFADNQDDQMEWYIGAGANIPVSISRASLKQEKQDWGLIAELGGMRGRLSGGIFFGVGLKDNLPNVVDSQNWLKWGLRANFALIK